ncbi:hypothetical protein [Streptodolium elevatio]|uniref:Exonuclease n=1 Tax=Streptodolium elevatio TaxID=3157996 RepID=A0ABV3DDD6_9ACTN
MVLNLVEIPQPAPTHPNHAVPRDGWGRPIIVPKAGGKPTGHTRTTTFIDCIEDKSNLNDWGKRMVLLGATKRPDLIAKAGALDPEADKKQLNALAEQAADASGANDKREKGTYLHSLTEYADRAEPLPPGASAADLEDIAAYMMATSAMTVVSAEQFVVVNQLGAAGTFDRLMNYDGPGPDGERITGNFIADVKTGGIEYGALKMASQLAVYSRGELYDHTYFPVDAKDKKALAAWKKRQFSAEEAAQAYMPLPDVNQEWGIIIHLPSGTGVCKLHWVDLTIGWELAQLALTIRKARTGKGKAMFPFRGFVEAPVVDTVGPSV